MSDHVPVNDEEPVPTVVIRPEAWKSATDVVGSALSASSRVETLKRGGFEADEFRPELWPEGDSSRKNDVLASQVNSPGNPFVESPAIQEHGAQQAPLTPQRPEAGNPAQKGLAPVVWNRWDAPDPLPSSASSVLEGAGLASGPTPPPVAVSGPTLFPLSQHPIPAAPSGMSSTQPGAPYNGSPSPEATFPDDPDMNPPTTADPPTRTWWELSVGVEPADPAQPPQASGPIRDYHPPAEDISPPVTPASGWGFRHAEVTHLGGAGVSVPIDRVGLLVTVRTPQRIRLGQVTFLREARNTIGRGRVACFVDDPGAAEVHAVVTCQRAGDASAFCLYSTPSAPVCLNEIIPSPMTELRSGDHLVIGSTELVFFEAVLTWGGRL